MSLNDTEPRKTPCADDLLGLYCEALVLRAFLNGACKSISCGLPLRSSTFVLALVHATAPVAFKSAEGRTHAVVDMQAHASLQLLRGLGTCLSAADSRALNAVKCLWHCTPCAQLGTSLRHARGTATDAQMPAAQPRARPVLKDLSSVPQLSQLNDELADAVRADRESARRSLYDALPTTLAAAGCIVDNMQTPVRLTEDILASLEVRSALPFSFP